MLQLRRLVCHRRLCFQLALIRTQRRIAGLTSAAAAAVSFTQELGLDTEIVAMACQAAEILMIMRQVRDAAVTMMRTVDLAPHTAPCSLVYALSNPLA
jgi:hypothetical protein